MTTPNSHGTSVDHLRHTNMLQQSGWKSLIYIYISLESSCNRCRQCWDLYIWLSTWTHLALFGEPTAEDSQVVTSGRCQNLQVSWGLLVNNSPPAKTYFKVNLQNRDYSALPFAWLVPALLHILISHQHHLCKPPVWSLWLEAVHDTFLPQCPVLPL